MTFVLASSSPRRLSLLADIGLKPDRVTAADIDETPQAGEVPRNLALRLARAKLSRVAADIREPAVILAADTVVGCGRRVLPKAETEEEVAKYLSLLSGRRHHVYTGVAVRSPEGEVFSLVSDSVVIFKRLTKSEIHSYVASGEGIGKAGGYAIQGLAATLIRFVSGSYSNIVGLPLYETAQLLRKSGMAV
jgi:septum formation protein